MDGDSTATPPPASSTSSPLSSTSPSSQELKATGVVPNLTAPEKRVARGYWWRDEEIKVYDELVAGYKTNAVNWEEVASELARRCPMDPAPARTATQCAARLVNINARRPGARPVQRWTDEGKLALHHAIQTTLAGENRNLSLKFSQGMGDHRKGSAPSTYRRSVPSALRSTAPSGSANPTPPAPQSQLKPPPPSSTAAQTSPLISQADRPFSPEDDEQLLELYRVKGAAYKIISRAVEPQRHKKEVNQRLDYLLQPYDFATFFLSDE